MDKRVTLFLILCLLFSLSAEAKDKFAAKGAKNPIKVAGQEFCNTNYRVWFAPNSWSYRMEGCLYGVQLAASVGTQNW